MKLTEAEMRMVFQIESTRWRWSAMMKESS